MMNGRAVGRVYLAAGPTDLRKSIDGLAVIVQELFQLDPFSKSHFVFCNRKRDKLKILFWDHNGFWLYYRRLEKGLFDWPELESVQPLSISSRQLNWLLDGLPLNQR
ncbi:IS66 family insertion sequence element accessory protein TnpB, partial [Sporosarcina sp. P20a]|uniref:IS66 family insertion sequence element accessory protein TnpB n=1 Tax=Sporosarcina sp. P20a TaxID=2048256 RepID=UPI00117A0AA8